MVNFYKIRRLLKLKRFEFFDSIEQTLPNFFPELQGKKIVDFVFTDYSTNKLIFSITFHMKDLSGEAFFSLSDFSSKFDKFNLFLARLGVINMEDMIEPKFEEDFRKYFFALPAEIMLKFTD